jgi:histidine triad (HIT) family protein
MMNDCIFCKIIDGVIPSQKVYEDEFVFAFRDIAPVTPVHILVIPKKHIVSAADVTEENSIYVAKCFEAIAKIATQEGLERGFRVITNSGQDGCQSVFHLHFHVLGGKLLPEGLI